VHVEAEDELALGHPAHRLDQVLVARLLGHLLVLVARERMVPADAMSAPDSARPRAGAAQAAQILHRLPHGCRDVGRDLDHRLEELRLDPFLLAVALEGGQDLVDPGDELVALGVEDLELLLDPRLNGALLPKFCSTGAATIAAWKSATSKCRGRVSASRPGADAGKPLFYWHGGGGGSEESAGARAAARGCRIHALRRRRARLRRPRLRSSPRGTPPRSSPNWRPGFSRALGVAPASLDRVFLGREHGRPHGGALSLGVRGARLLDGGYLVAEDDPDYDLETDYEDELEELRRRAEEGASWDAPPEVIGAAMVASRLAPCPPLYPRVRESGFQSCSSTRRSRRTAADPRTGSGPCPHGAPRGSHRADPERHARRPPGQPGRGARILLDWLEERG
jgi:hypothetical protein